MRSNRFELPTAANQMRISRGRISPAGWHVHAHRAQSPNADARPADERIELIVIHNISLPPGKFGGRDVQRLFTNRLRMRDHPDYPAIGMLKVSAHFFIRRDGRLLQFVSTQRRAWHAGASAWRGRERCNDFSIGIELEGTDVRPYTGRQYRRLARLVQALVKRYPDICGVAGHDEIAPGRKTDPGASFDWPRFIAQSGLPQRFRELN